MQSSVERNPQQDYWNQTLERMASEFDVVADQLRDAATEFPELVGRFGLLLAFTTYRHDTEGASPFAASLRSLTTQLFARSSATYACVNGNEAACNMVGWGRDNHDGPEPTECHQLYQAYIAKRREERDALQGSPWDRDDSIKLADTIRASEVILSQLRNLGCA